MLLGLTGNPAEWGFSTFRWLGACFALWALLSLPTNAQTKISNLPAAGALTGVEAFPCVQSAVTDKCTVTQAVTFTYSLLSGDCTATSGGAITCSIPVAHVTGLGALATQATPCTIAQGCTGQTTANPAFNALSPMTTIGDIIYGAASGVATRLANGTSGMFLGANTGAAPSWQTPAGGGSAPLSTYSTTRTYAFGGTAAAAGAASTANVITCGKGIVYQKLTISVLTVNISTGGSSNFQMALYNDTNGLPGTLLNSTPSVVDTSTLGANGTLSGNVQIGPGAVWFCTNQNDSTVVFTSLNRAQPASFGDQLVGVTTGVAGVAQLISGAATVAGLSCSGANCNTGSSTFGTWQDLTGSTWTTVVGNTVPDVFFTPFSIP